MVIQAMLESLINSLLQIGTALIITILQRWLLQLSTPEKDWCWFQRTRLYQAFQSAKWYRGLEVYHQARAYRLLGDVL